MGDYYDRSKDEGYEERLQEIRQRRRKPAKRSRYLAVIAVLSVVLVLLIGFLIWDINREQDEADPLPPDQIQQNTGDTGENTGDTSDSTQDQPEPVTLISTATLGATGDVLMHEGNLNAGRESDGSYNFDEIFQYMVDDASAVDYAAINLETTLAGTENGYAYSGYPCFNTPDSIIDSIKWAGFDMVLTANNHSYDTRMKGYLRTLSVIREKGLETLGTMADEEEPKFVIQDINGISVGMICYTYETSDGTGEYPYLNGIPMSAGSYGMINCFRMEDPEPFYQELEGYLADMEAAGAEATVLFIHWGVEYQLSANATQKAMAQKICDLGVDVIIGGHPHVVQPVELLESSVDPSHTTVCLYSMGNAVSNQRTGAVSAAPDGYTEDGLFFTVTFAKYSDGTVYVQDANVLPTWVKLTVTNGQKEFNILPLHDDQRSQWQSLFSLTDSQLSQAEKAYDRTMGIVGEGLTEVRQFLADAKQQREDAYAAAVS